MRSITSEECAAWARERGVRLAESQSLLHGAPLTEALRFTTPDKACVQIAWSEALVETIPEIAQSLLWITD